MDMDINIREIENKDYTSIGAIWREALGFLSTADEIVVETFEKMKEDSRYRTFVADVNGTVVGFVTTVKTLAIDHPNGYMKVNGLAVLSEFQHCGIGKKLMEHVEKLAREQNVSMIGLASGFQRTGAHEFYEHLGYEKSSFWFRKRM
ncbi:MAG: GNAT family N-acetyltransferase [Lachnospiraceae bacterium]